MKKYLLSLVLMLGIGSLAWAQPVGQNPRAKEAHQKYQVQADSSHAATMGATIDKTYVAHDPIRIKEERKEERREFRRQLRLERARNRNVFWGNRNPYGFYYPYW